MSKFKKLYQNFRNIFAENQTSEIVKDLLDFINNNEIRFNKIENYSDDNLQEIKFNRDNNKINIPGDFLILDENKDILSKTQASYGKKAIEVIISHEIGHSIQYRYLRLKEGYSNADWNIAKYGDICLTEIDRNNTDTKNAEDFLKVNNKIPNGIERFMQQNFMESYADCYSGLIVYLKNSYSENIFEQIKDYRTSRISDIKNKTEIIPKGEMIIDGKFAITEYANIYGVEKFNNNFMQNFLKEDIMNIVQNNFEAVHHIIQTEVLDGLYKTMKEEAKSNPLFLLELKDFCKNRHNCSINDFFKEFENHVSNVRKVHCLYEPTNVLDNGMPFYDYDKESTKISKTNIIEEYKETLSSDGLKKFDKLGINDIILNQFPENYAKSNYDIMTKINNKFEISLNIFSLREKTIGQKEQYRSNLKL